MKAIFKLLVPILCLELILAPMGGALVVQETLADENNCGAGYSWSASTGRCVIKQETANVLNSVDNCKDLPSGEAMQQCYDKNAKDAAARAQNDGKIQGNDSGLMRGNVQAGAVAIPLLVATYVILNKRKDRTVKCRPASLLLMYGAAGVLAAGEIITYFTHQSKLDEMKDRWKQINVPKTNTSADAQRTQSTEAQSQAFEFLAQNEDSIASTAKTKFVYMAATTGLFAAGMVMGVVEKIQLTKARAMLALASTSPQAVQDAKKTIQRVTCGTGMRAKDQQNESKNDCERRGGKYNYDGKELATCTFGTGASTSSNTGNPASTTNTAQTANAQTANAQTAGGQTAGGKPQNDSGTMTREECEDSGGSIDYCQRLDPAPTKPIKPEAQTPVGSNPETSEIDKEKEELARKQKEAELKSQEANSNALKQQAYANVKAKQIEYDNKRAECKILNQSVLSAAARVRITQTNLQYAQNKMDECKIACVIQQKNLNVAKLNESDARAILEGARTKNNSCEQQAQAIYFELNQLQKKADTAEYLPNQFELEKIKAVSVHNLKNSQNAYELMELLQEYESIEFENYSKVSYLGEGEKEILKTASWDKSLTSIILSGIIPEAFAQMGSENCSGFSCADKPGCVFKEDNENGEPQFICTNNPADNNGTQNGGSANGSSSDGTSSGDSSGGTSAVDLAGKAISLFGGRGKPSGDPATILANPILANVTTVDGQVNPNRVESMKTDGANKTERAFNSPVTRIAINGVLGTWIGIMTAEMKRQADISEKRADYLRTLKSDFKTQGGLLYCKEADRHNSAKPSCYCYTSDNQKNPSRANSKICKDLPVNLKSGTYKTTASTAKICMDKNQNLDPSCKCKTEKAKDGTNNCMKAGAALNLNGFNPGTFKMLSSTFGPVNDLTNGNMSASQMNGDSINQNAIRVRAAAEDLLNKSDPQGSKEVKAFAKDFEKGMMDSTSGLRLGGAGGGSGLSGSGSMGSMTPAEAAAALDKELKDNTPVVNSADGGPGVNAGGTGAAEAQPEFGMTEEQLANQEEQIAEVMNKDIDFGANDINTGSTTNLFEILSNRYQRSGLRGLFDTEGKTEADKPAESEINK